MKDGWYWYYTARACGGIQTKQGIIIATCPIFRKMIGKPANYYKNLKLIAKCVEEL